MLIAFSLARADPSRKIGGVWYLVHTSLVSFSRMYCLWSAWMLWAKKKSALLAAAIKA